MPSCARPAATIAASAAKLPPCSRITVPMWPAQFTSEQSVPSTYESASRKLNLKAPTFGDFVTGVFTPVLAKHSKSFSLLDSIAVGVDRMQRNFAPMRKQVETRQRTELVDVTAKMIIYEAFIEDHLEAPKHLARRVHDLYFEPKYEEFRSRTIWSLSNAFTSAFKELDPIPQFKATAKLGQFLEARFSRSF